MKKHLENLLSQALEAMLSHGLIESLPAQLPPFERTRDKQHGDFATNAALVLAKAAGMPPRVLAQHLVDAFPADGAIEKLEIAGPGFVNVYISPSVQFSILPIILEQRDQFGRSQKGKGQKVQVEFVSANPTGPLHVGHGRGAAYGAAVSDLLEAIGYDVHREYYVNDAGRQMDILAASVWLRYLELCGVTLVFPVNGYRGEYVRDIAAQLREDHGDRYLRVHDEVFSDLPLDENQGGDKEIYIDAVVQRAREMLGEADYRIVFDAGLHSILEDIRQDLGEMGVVYDEWFSERSLSVQGAVARETGKLASAGYLYQEAGATWFASTRLGDEKDRVVIRENGQMTYFASDIAYHANKYARGYARIVNVWGADHHGYIPRVKAALEALGEDRERLEVLLVQFAVLYRGEERVQMSTRSGEFVTLRQLRHEVGRDAVRFFYVMRKSDQHMDFDLKLATSRSNENPVYYVQYAHARVCSVLRQLVDKGWDRDTTLGFSSLGRLDSDQESELCTLLARYPEVVESAALQYAPHHVVHYVRDLASAFHTYYNSSQFLVDDAPLRNARLNLVDAVRQVLSNALLLLGVSAPEVM